MNIVQFFKDASEKWDLENKCGFCWTFGAPLSESGMNASEPKDEDKCCVHLFITHYKTSSSYTKNPNTGLKNREWCDHLFVMYAVQHSDIGTNIYNEQPFYPIDESLWKTKVEPIQNCLGCGNELDLCELGYEFEILKWEMEVVTKYEDMNYSGWKIAGIFRQYF
ncbi:hypothetical protein CMT52_19515 [Elizabethkingia anophelis]|nr:hypothetical protein [Elizabethkingia anophelis]